MKKLLISSALTVALFSSGAYAQVQLPEITISSTTTSGLKVSPQVISTFEKTFSNAMSMKWYDVNNRYLVNFIQNDLRNHALFTKSGRMVYHILYGFEKNLPMPLTSQIKNEYKNYAITSAVNVKQSVHNVWMVNLENAKGYIKLRLADGQMEELQKIKNSGIEMAKR